MATKTHAGAFRDECEPQKQFADSGSLLETWVNMFFVHKPRRCECRDLKEISGELVGWKDLTENGSAQT